jgi:HEPN domain-containing protein
MREVFFLSADEKASRFMELSARFIQDAKVLAKGSRWATAVYVAGYSLECALKYAVCVHERRTVLQKKYRTHRFDVLIDAAGIRRELERPANARLNAWYKRINQLWSESIRYATGGLAPAEVRDAIKIFEELRKWVLHLAVLRRWSRRR